MRAALILLTVLPLVACTPPSAAKEQPIEWAIAIHGGAGAIPKDTPAEVRREYEEALATALKTGAEMLKADAEALDVVEAVARVLEDDPHFNAGRGAVFTAQRKHELDASIMDGRDLSCGAVAGVTIIRNPIRLARLVKEKTRHVLLQGSGADAFGREMKVDLVENSYFTTPRRKEQIDAYLRGKKGTIGVVVRDSKSNLAAGTSTGGLTGKKYGRVGDSPIIGAGTYADNRTVAVSCTGTGEEYIRHAVAHTVSMRVALLGESVEAAAKYVIHEVLAKDDGGLIAVDKNGRIAMDFNTPGMYRAAADSSGRFEVLIWR